MKPIVGIDLGTTNSEVAIIREGRPLVIADAAGKQIVPSFVGRSPTGEMLVGELARNQYTVDPERTIKSIKRKMGSDERVNLGEETYTPPEISAFILRRLKSMAEEFLGESVEQAVITVPANFSDKQRQATKDAGEIAGLEVLRIINEPTAAALAYRLDREEDQFLVVYDLGGGTFDVSVIEINSGVVEVRASHGNTELGGDDFDAALVKYIAEDFKQQHGIDLQADRRSLARLTRAAEAAKIQLSDAPFAQIREEFIATQDGKPLHLEMEIERSRFEALVSDMLESTIECVQQALEDASLSADEINKVLLVGGSTRIPRVADILEDVMMAQPHLEVDPDLCVAMGASAQAGIIAGEPIDAVLVDVSPHSLGIEVAEWQMMGPVFDQYNVIIRRNTPVPVSKSEVYTTLSPDQKNVEIKVYQGEEPIASHNTLLGEFLLEGVKQTKRGQPEIIVNFDYDVNGIVHVSGKDKRTGAAQEITVTATPDRLTEEQKADATERVGDVEIVWDAAPTDSHEDAVVLLERASEVDDSLADGEEKTDLRELISALETALGNQDEEAIDELQEELLDLLYDLED
ncbi:MAG: Hsp70 family protein [Candidatus Poribacteria bacterium]|nr:Hsp70 family protein [Candidatus Poribacteria bacterium]